MTDAPFPQPETPDFAALYPLPDDEGEYQGWRPTPRTAWCLWEAADYLADTALMEAEELGDDPIGPDNIDSLWVFYRYPPLVYQQGRIWRRHAVHALEDLRDAFATGDESLLPYTPAEEMAMWMIVEDAEERCRVEECPRPLPEHPDDLTNSMWEYLFHDHDILFLFNQNMAGVEDPDDPMHHIAPDIANYNPEVWFETFWNAKPRRPDRPSYQEDLAASRRPLKKMPPKPAHLRKRT